MKPLKHTSCGGAPCYSSVQAGQIGLIAGQTDFAGEPSEETKRLTGTDPVRAAASWVVLGSAGSLERPQTP